MLKALYDYGIRHELTPPPGYSKKQIKAYVSLSALSKDYVKIHKGDKEAIPCPDIGSLANGTDKSNVFVEKRSVIFSKEPTAKYCFFLEALKAYAQLEPKARICVEALEDEETREKICQELDRNKIKASDRVSFWIDGRSILEGEKIQEWWQEFRKQFQLKDRKAMSVCLITGQPVIPMITTTPVNGLTRVGGHARGDALICFDKSAFCSYGLKKAANAPVSEEAFATVKAALDELLAKAPILAGMKFVHWYDQDVEPQEDPIFAGGDFEAVFEDDENDEEDEAEEQKKESVVERKQKELDAEIQADELINSVNSGKAPLSLQNRYYILMLTGVGGRVMIRHYEYGSYQKLKDNLELWHKDLELTNRYGTSSLRSCKLTARLIRLLKQQKRESQIFKRLEKELSGLTEVVIKSVLCGTRLPDVVAARSLAYIRSQMLSAPDDGDKDAVVLPDGRSCQWLKVWLLRKERERKQEESLMREYNKDHPLPAYHMGALMAICAAIQQKAMPEMNTGIVQRYYASACQSPALVLGILSRKCHIYLDKINRIEIVEVFEKQLSQVSLAVGDQIPKTLNLEEQSYFALGYYQKWAELSKLEEKKKAD